MKWFLLKKLFGLNVLTDRMKTSSQSPAPGSTASHQGVRVQLPLSPLWETGFLFCSPVTRSSRTRVNTSAVFLHQSSSFLIEVHVFDIVSCMQKAHWYCEWITVNVIDSFIIFFFSFCYFDVLLSPNFTALPVASFVRAQTDSVWLSCVQYFCPVCRKNFVFSFFIFEHLLFLNEAERSRPAESNNIWSEYSH